MCSAKALELAAILRAELLSSANLRALQEASPFLRGPDGEKIVHSQKSIQWIADRLNAYDAAHYDPTTHVEALWELSSELCRAAAADIMATFAAETPCESCSLRP